MFLGSKNPETRLVVHTTPKALLFNALKNKLHLDESISSSLNESGLKLGGSSSGSLSSSHSLTDSSKRVLHAVSPIIEEREEDCTAFVSDQSKVTKESSSHQAESHIVANSLNPQHDAVDKKIVELERWTIQLLPNQKLCLEGHQKGDGGGETFHRSGPVSKRLDSDLIQTVSGQLYQLSGRVRRQSLGENGSLKKVLHYFHYGFPDNWEELLHNALSAKPSSSSSSSESRKTRKKTRPTNGSSSPVLANVKLSKDSSKVIPDPEPSKTIPGSESSSKTIPDSEPSKNIPDPEPTKRCSKRFRVPPLAWWASQRLVVDPVTQEAKIAQEFGNALSYLQSLQSKSAMEDIQKQSLHGKRDTPAKKKRSKEESLQNQGVDTTESKTPGPGNCSEMSASGSSKVVHSSGQGDIGTNSRKIVKNKTFSRSIFSEGGLDNSISGSANLPSKTVTRNAADKAGPRFAGKMSGIEKTGSGKFDLVSDVDESAKKRTEKRLTRDHRAKAGKSYRSPSSLDDVNDNEPDGVSKKILSRKRRSRLFDSDFTSDDDSDAGPGSKRTKKRTKTKQNPKVSKAEEKSRVDGKQLRIYSREHYKGSNNSSLKRCKVVLENCSSDHLEDQVPLHGQCSCSNSSRGRNQQSCHDKMKFFSPKHTSSSNTKCGNFDQERSGKKGNIRYLRQEGSVEFIYSKPSPSGKIVVQTRDSQWPPHEEDPFSFLNEDPMLKSLPQRPVPSKDFISVNLSEADDSDDVDYFFSSDEG